MPPPPPEEPALWRCGSIEYDEGLQELRVGGEAVRVERVPLRVLQLLLRAGERLVTTDALLSAIWNRDRGSISRNALSNAVAKLRRALGPEGQRMVVALPQSGYRLAETWQCLPCPGHAAGWLTGGGKIPHAPGWQLTDALHRGLQTVSWRARHSDGRQAVFKFALAAGPAPAALRRELHIARLLSDAFGERPEFAPLTLVNLAQAPHFLASLWRGHDMRNWAQGRGGLAAVALDERLAVVAAMAAALAAAHSIGIVHKNIKPDNVLVTRSDRKEAEVCIIDFGSGEVPGLPRESGELPGATETQAPEAERAALMYAAPERLVGRPATVAADVFACGVLLYQCIVADFDRPISPGWEREIEDELLREDVESATWGDPAGRMASLQELVTRLRSLPERRRDRQQKQEQARQSEQAARQLALARASRPWKWAAWVMLAIGASVSLYFARQAQSERDEARSQYLRAQSINDFLAVGFLQAANPARGGDADITLLQAMRQAGDHLDTELQGAPSTAAALHQAIGNNFLALNEFADALPHFERALAITTQLFGPEGDETLNARCDLLAAKLFSGHPERAGPPVDGVRQALREPTRLSLPTRCKCHQLLGNLAAAEGRDREATEEFFRMNELVSRNPSSTPRQRGLARAVYAHSLVRLGRTEEGQRILRGVVRDFEQQFGVNHFDTLSARLMLAQTLKVSGAADESRKLYDQIISVYRTKYGERSPLVLRVMKEAAGPRPGDSGPH